MIQMFLGSTGPRPASLCHGLETTHTILIKLHRNNPAMVLFRIFITQSDLELQFYLSVNFLCQRTSPSRDSNNSYHKYGFCGSITK